MTGRNVALVGTLMFLVLLGTLTIDVIVREGFDVLVVISLVILGMVGFGVAGALLRPPEQ
ncbi:MAG: hypothetical protein WD993_00365 [Thermoleophilaceae bacterium]